MDLNRLLSLKRLTVLGLNSGTSADSVDLALLKVQRSPRGATVRFVRGAERKFPPTIRRRILAAAGEEEIAYESLLALDALLGEFLGKAAAAFIKKLPKSERPVHLIASHGQTIQHLPKAVAIGNRKISGTIQLGSLDRIANQTGCVTVGDFRQGDIAAGGEGAPITTPAMVRLFGDKSESRLIVNIGGIANYFYLPAGGQLDNTKAADCGPGNMLIDGLCMKLFDTAFDRNGAIAQRGTIHQPMLTQLLKHPFLRTTRRRSTGREEFGEALLARILDSVRTYRVAKDDLITTITELTAQVIARSVQPLFRQDPRLTKFYLTGGGSHNKFLRSRLTVLLPDVSLLPIDSLGIPAGLVEAAAFGVLGEACLRGEAMPVRRRITNNRATRPILGHLVQPPVPVR